MWSLCSASDLRSQSATGQQCDVCLSVAAVIYSYHIFVDHVIYHITTYLSSLFDLITCQVNVSVCNLAGRNLCCLPMGPEVTVRDLKKTIQKEGGPPADLQLFLDPCFFGSE